MTRGLWQHAARSDCDANDNTGSKTSIEIGVGTGVHAIAALKLGVRTIDVTDIDPVALASANDNAHRNGVAFRNAWQRDWMSFAPPEPYDLVLCNPPFCKAGTTDRRFFIKALIRESPRFLRPGGYLLFVQSSMANLPATEQQLADAGFFFARVHESRGLFCPWTIPRSKLRLHETEAASGNDRPKEVANGLSRNANLRTAIRRIERVSRAAHNDRCRSCDGNDRAGHNRRSAVRHHGRGTINNRRGGHRHRPIRGYHRRCNIHGPRGNGRSRHIVCSVLCHGG